MNVAAQKSPQDMDRFIDVLMKKMTLEELKKEIRPLDETSMEQARKMIATIVTDFEAGMVLEGDVVSIKEFGAFIEFAPGKEGMVHISKIAKQRIDHVEDVLSIGDHVKVVCLGKDKMGRLSFSIKDVAE